MRDFFKKSISILPFIHQVIFTGCLVLYQAKGDDLKKISVH